MAQNSRPKTTNYSNNLPIKSWAEEDRPREKLLLQGHKKLTDAELLAIVIGTGSRKETAVSLAKRMLQAVNHDLRALGKCTIPDLKKFNGVGEAKAITIKAVLELGKRMHETPVEEGIRIASSRDAFNLIGPYLNDLPHEEFWIFLLNRANKLIKKHQISSGGVSGTIVDVKLIFKSAMEELASSIILCHNHPSGNLKPSNADIEITKKIKNSGEIMDVKVLDHVIVAGKGYYSFADEGVL